MLRAILIAIFLGEAAFSADLMGRVTTQFGDPLPETEITIRSLDGEEITEVVTNDDGQFSVSDLPPETVRLDIVSPGFKRLLATAALDENTPTKISVGLRVAEIGLTVAVKDTPQIRTKWRVKGVVKRLQDGSTVSRATLCFISADEDPPILIRERARADGTFTVDLPEIGPYKVVARDDDSAGVAFFQSRIEEPITVLIGAYAPDACR